MRATITLATINGRHTTVVTQSAPTQLALVSRMAQCVRDYARRQGVHHRAVVVIASDLERIA